MLRAPIPHRLPPGPIVAALWLCPLLDATAAARPQTDPPRFRVEVVSRNPDHGAIAEVGAAAGEFAGTRGEGKDVFRLRFLAALPDGLELVGSSHWGDAGDRPVRAGEWLGTSTDPAAATMYLRGLRLGLSGPDAERWRLRYRAHVAWRGDTPWHGAGSLLGQRGEHRFCFQGVEVALERRRSGEPRALELVLTGTRPIAVARATEWIAIEVGDGTPRPTVHGPLAAPDDADADTLAWRGTLGSGGTRRLHLLAFEPAATPGPLPGRPREPSAARRMLARVLSPAELDALAACALPTGAPRGGFSVHVSLSDSGRLEIVPSAMPGADTRVVPDRAAHDLAGARAVSVEMRRAGVRLIAIVADSE